MPIYLLVYKKGDKTYTYAMNGDTGKIYGQYPLSGTKLFLLNFFITLAGLILMIIASSGALFILFILAIALIITNIVIFAIYKGSVNNPYPIKELSTIEFSESKDIFRHSTTTKREIHNNSNQEF